MSRPGFRPREDEEELEPETPNYGVGHAGGVSDNQDDDDGGWHFTKLPFFAIQIGPIAIVFGRADV